MELGTCLACDAKNIENGTYSECPACGERQVITYWEMWENEEPDPGLAYERHLEDACYWEHRLQEQMDAMFAPFDPQR